jgi:hypothetical protein
MRRVLKPVVISLLSIGVSAAWGQSLSKLPDWARQAVEASLKVQQPADAEAWVLLDRTEVAYTGDGEIREHRYRVVRVLGERGVGEGIYQITGDGAEVAKVKKLKGWNLRPDGDLEKMDKDDVLSLEGLADGEGGFSKKTWTAGGVSRVVKGSVVAFESLEVLHRPMGAFTDRGAMEDVPVLRWEVVAAKKEGWFSNLKQVALKLDLRNFDAWKIAVEQGPGSVAASNLPPKPKAELFRPEGMEVFPEVTCRFLDPAFKDAPDWSTWDGLADFTSRTFATAGREPVPGLAGADPAAKLRSLGDWMYRNLSYRAIYLSPNRGWVPEKASETSRKRFGDCKDFAAFLMGGAKDLGFESVPVLASIQDIRVEPSMAPAPLFNHAIAAIRLEKSLGFPAEVETPSGRFLVVDPTDHYTPLGYLGDQHRGRWVMLCLPGKAVWVQIPDTAIAPNAVHLSLTAACDAKGVLDGTIRIEEAGNAWALRQAATELAPKDFLLFVRKQGLSLSAMAACEVRSHSDPLDLNHPFQVELKVRVPDVAAFDGTEVDLDLPGFLRVPPKPLRNGEARRYPMEFRSSLHLVYAASLRLPQAVAPVSPGLASSTCCRTISFKAQASAVSDGTQLKIDLDSQATPAAYGFQELKDGAKAFAADRAAILRLHQDGLAFKIQT